MLQAPEVKLGAEAERAISRANEAKDTSQLQEQLKELRVQLEKERTREQQQRKVSAAGTSSATQLCERKMPYRCHQLL